MDSNQAGRLALLALRKGFEAAAPEAGVEEGQPLVDNRLLMGHAHYEN